MNKITRNIDITEENKYLVFIDLLSIYNPYSLLRKREKQVFAMLLEIYNKYPNLDIVDRNKLTIGYDSRQAISDKLNVSKFVVYNIMTELKEKQIIIESETGHDIINPKYAIPDLDSITFNFITK